MFGCLFYRILEVLQGVQGSMTVDIKRAYQDLINEFNMDKIEMDFGLATRNVDILCKYKKESYL